MNTETQAVSELQVKETLAFCPSDCGSLGDQQVPSKIYSGTLIENTLYYIIQPYLSINV